MEEEVKKYNIVVVDDEPHVVNLIRLCFSSTKYVVTGYYSAEDCLNNLTEETDVYLIDLIMPKQNGYSLMKELREKSKSRKPIIVVSSKCKISDKLDAIEHGADDYICKPFDPLEIEKRVRLVLEDYKR